jgi:hypothetical protein
LCASVAHTLRLRSPTARSNCVCLRSLQRDASGAISTAFTYACLGKMPLVGTALFSFNILSRSPRWALSDIAALVASANATTRGRLEMSGMRYSDAAAYAGCGVL